MRNTVALLQLAIVTVILASCILFGLVYIGNFRDDVAYHIPAAVRIAQHRNPYFVNSPVDSHWFPAGAETVVAVLVWMSGSLNVANVSGAACAIALVVLLYRFAGIWCRDRLPCLATAGCVATIPLLIAQSMAFYVDIHLALVVCLSLYLLCQSVVRRAAGPAYAACAVALLAPSIKYSGLLLLLVLTAAGVVCVSRATPPRAPSRAVMVSLLAVALFSSGWYVRNWMERGNPLFPFAAPSWSRPLLAIVGAPYELDPEHTNISPRTAFPHPFIPQTWLRYEFAADMADDAFGASTVVAALCVLLSLLRVGQLPADQRRTWVFLWIVTVMAVAAVPFRLQIPRYVLFVAVVAALGPAVLSATARSARGRMAVDLVCYAICAYSAAYVFANLIVAGPVNNSVPTAFMHLVPYQPIGVCSYPYVQRGNLRIGYTSGYSNYIAMLYDTHLTNTLIPLHYKNYPYNYWRQFESADEFVRYVEGLHLDYIHIFDARYPGVDLLRQHFPEQIMPDEMRPQRPRG